MTQQYSNGYTFAFAAGVCLVCSVFVAGAAVALKDRQEENKVLDKQKKVLEVAGLVKPGEKVSPEDIKTRFEANIVPRLVDADGNYVEGDAATYDWGKAMKDPEGCKPLEALDPSKVKCIPETRLVYEVVNKGQISQVILPVEGKGLWSTLYGFLALEPDGATVSGIIFYQHGETPGLGGEVDNPRWRAIWKGRRLYDDKGAVALSVTKGAAGSASEDPYRVDGLSGATLTSRGVTHLVHLWAGPQAFQPYLVKLGAGELGQAPAAGKGGAKPAAGAKGAGKTAPNAGKNGGKKGGRPVAKDKSMAPAKAGKKEGG